MIPLIGDYDEMKMMRRLVFMIAGFIMGITACSQPASPDPTLDVTATPTATATVQFSADDATAAATFIRTLPASFTPTFTPSITPTRNTDTPTARPSVTLIPETDLCDRFVVSPIPLEEVPADDAEDYIQVFIDEESVVIDGVITNLTADEVVGTVALRGGVIYDIQFTPEFYPEVGDYEYVFSLRDRTRDGLCERSGTFDTRSDEVAGAEVTAEATGIFEVTLEVTDPFEVTAEVTQAVEMTAPVEATAEATEPIEATIGVIVEVTAEPVATPQQPRFPPR